MPKLQPEAAIVGKIRQSIRILQAHIRKINTQNHRADKLHFIQRFLRLLLVRDPSDSGFGNPLNYFQQAKSERKMIQRSIVALLAVGFSALGEDAEAADSRTIVQEGRAFNPSEVTIARGDLLRFNNRDDFIHQIYIASDVMNFESDEQSPGQAVTLGFPTSGTFAVRCHIHPRMLLIVHVK